MLTGAVTSEIDVAQIVLYAFWIFFAGLILYLRREDKREGYPLAVDPSDRPRRGRPEGFPALPTPKVFKLANGETRTAPYDDKEADREIRAVPTAPWPGAPLEPTGNPMLDGVGPASYALRSETPERTHHGDAKIVPMRVASDFMVESRDPDPRGMAVIAADRQVAGTVVDIWVDRGEHLIRYLEVELAGGEGGRRVLLPISFAGVSSWSWRNKVTVRALMASQFADVPALQNPDEVTMREEDRICAYYASGYLYANPQRQEPLL